MGVDRFWFWVPVDAGEEENMLFGPAADRREGVGVGTKRSATWFATMTAQLCSFARLRRRAPKRMSCAERVARAEGALAELRSAR